MKMMYNTYRLLAAAILVAAFTACGDSEGNVMHESYIDIPDQNWEIDNVLEYNVEVTDTVLPYQFYLNVRHSADYAYSNIYFFMETAFPNGKTSNDTIECTLAQPSGRWNGQGVGDLYEGKYVVKYAKRFPLTGNYTFSVKHAMRENPLEGIDAIGFSLEEYIKE